MPKSKQSDLISTKTIIFRAKGLHCLIQPFLIPEKYKK
jgi:hypothetical protein